MPWTDERVAVLRKMWTEGQSAAAIARELGGVTRNAVLGKISRLGMRRASLDNHTVNKKRLRRQRPVVQRRPKATAQKASAPKPATELAAIAALAPIDPTLNVQRLTPMACRYPIGDPVAPDFAFCGRTCEGSPYCVQHAKIAYTPTKKPTLAAQIRLANWLDRHTFKRAAL